MRIPDRMLKNFSKDQRGINMVDLMMWLVIAALLLAAALQAIGYYQKAAYIYEMESDLSGAGSLVVSSSSMREGLIDKPTADAAMLTAKWSAGVAASVEVETTGTIPYLRATHPGVTDRDAIYLFQSCGDFQAGVNIVPKGGTPALEACGITAGSSGGTVTGPTFNTLTWTDKSTAGNAAITLGNASWSAFAATSDGKIMVATKGTISPVLRSTDGGATWTALTSIPDGAYGALSMSKNGSDIVIGSQNGNLYYSQDSGATFALANVGVAANGQGAWYGVASSGDGKVIVAGDYNNQVWVSKDSGSSWTAQSDATLGTVGTWVSAAVSNDGTKITVGARNGYVYTSNGNGTWSKAAPTGTASGEWYAMTSSTNGDVQFTAKYSGQIWKSVDGGVSWNVVTASPTAKWRSLAVSDDGTKLAAGTFDGAFYVSKDGGTTWTAQTDLAAVGPYYGIGMSSDGSVIVTGKSNGHLYVGNYGG